MEGIETHTTPEPGRASSHVSRCPDMEGIETLLPKSSNLSKTMSVGAPTWRGLKHALYTVRVLSL